MWGSDARFLVSPTFLVYVLRSLANLLSYRCMHHSSSLPVGIIFKVGDGKKLFSSFTILSVQHNSATKQRTGLR
uniref:Secreted protein n=1 Tax=Anopheles gambiae TaxID=7165 RepID=A0ABK8G7P0_ANOGA